MPLDAAIKKQTIEEFATHEGDTGSPEVQVAVLTRRIAHLTEHLKEHKHDHHSRRGLMLLVGQRRRLLNYVAKTDINRYRSLIDRLGLRRCHVGAVLPGLFGPARTAPSVFPHNSTAAPAQLSIQLTR